MLLEKGLDFLSLVHIDELPWQVVSLLFTVGIIKSRQ